MCGIVGLFGGKDVVFDLYEGLISIQHRGQDAAGIATFDQRFHLKKGYGLVRDVFTEKNMSRLKGNIGIGHVRYPTIGMGTHEDAQPFYVNSPFGVCMAHNGNIINYRKLKERLFRENHRHLNSSCDLEVVLNVFADQLSRQKIRKVNAGHIFQTVKGVFEAVQGSYSVVGMVADVGLVAFRDPYGIRPLIMGEREEKGAPGGKAYAFASESVVLDLLSFHKARDVGPGEAIFIDLEGRIHAKRLVERKHQPCIFEFVYFARPDSFIDKISVNKTRKRLGEALAKEWRKTGRQPDAIVPVPDSARTAALAMASDLTVKYTEGLVKNRYIGRTFLMPGQDLRRQSVKRKLNAIQVDFKGKKVLIVDDSIVRGNTSKEIIQFARKAGAKEVYFASYSPPLRFPCIYGIDMSTRGEFVAQKYSVEEICKKIDADFLLYQTVENLVSAARKGNPDIESFCTACFTGSYPTGDVDDSILEEIELERKKAGEKWCNCSVQKEHIEQG